MSKFPNPFTTVGWVSLWPAATVIPAPLACMKISAVETHVCGGRKKCWWAWRWQRWREEGVYGGRCRWVRRVECRGEGGDRNGWRLTVPQKWRQKPVLHPVFVDTAVRGASRLENDTAEACGVVRVGVVFCVALACLECPDSGAWTDSCTMASDHSSALFALYDGALSMLSTQPVPSSAPSDGTVERTIVFSHSLALTPVGTTCKCGVKPRETVNMLLTTMREENREHKEQCWKCQKVFCTLQVHSHCDGHSTRRQARERCKIQRGVTGKRRVLDCSRSRWLVLKTRRAAAAAPIQIRELCEESRLPQRTKLSSVHAKHAGSNGVTA